MLYLVALHSEQFLYVLLQYGLYMYYQIINLVFMILDGSIYCGCLTRQENYTNFIWHMISLYVSYHNLL